MPTMIYTPGVRVYIDTARNGIVDVSEDLNNGTMVRRSDGMSTFNFVVSNPRRKYDSVFTPNDRIVVVMKRLAWVRTFTGLLSTVPLVTGWPKPVSIAAGCSLKRLLYWFWDSYATATQQMIAHALVQSQSNDGGVTGVVLTILNEVVGWPPSKVHISQIPDNWFDIAKKVAADVEALAEQSDALAAQYKDLLSSKGLINGTSGTTIKGALKEGTYGGVALSQEQVGNAETIVSVARSLGASDRDVTITLATAMQESSLTNLDHGDRDSVGLFQQRPSCGWGTKQQCMDPTYATTQFVSRLLKVASRDSMTETQAAQAVQASGFPNAYQQWVIMAREIVRVLNASGATIDPTKANAPNASSGATMAKVGIDFVQQYPNVPYSQSTPATPAYLAQNPPPYLDCGTFVSSMYLRTMGSLNGMPRDVTGMTAWALANGGKRLSVQEAINTPGALMIKTQEHVEMSIGDGQSTVGAHKPGTPAKIDQYPGSYLNYWDFGLLLPGLSYSIGGTVAFSPATGGVVTGTDAANATASAPFSTLAGYNPNDPIDKIFGNAQWATDTMGGPESDLANSLTGVRALLNDQPLLPYIMNLFNSTMRSFCSAPNGDLIAWFPDYYGLWGTAAKMVLEPIEVQDFNVEWSDDSLVTHMFTLAGQRNSFDVGSGSVQGQMYTQSGPDIRTETVGIANIDIPAVMWALFGIEATKEESDNFARFIYKRFGARPHYQEMSGLVGPKAEFFSALFMFMRLWAYQYNADIPITFMPELWPGMLVQIPAFDFQAYVTTVTHSFRFGQGGGFSTSINIAAPARMPKADGTNDHVLLGMPLAGDYKPGRGVGNIAAVADDTLTGGPAPAPTPQRTNGFKTGRVD